RGAPVRDVRNVAPAPATAPAAAPNFGGWNGTPGSAGLNIGLQDVFADPLTGESPQPRRIGSSSGSVSSVSSFYVDSAARIAGPSVPASGLSSSSSPGTAGAMDANFPIPALPGAPSPVTAGSNNATVLAPSAPSGSGPGGAQSPALNAFAHFSGIILSPTQQDSYTLQLPAADIVVPN